jgi:hypothetical protein
LTVKIEGEEGVSNADTPHSVTPQSYVIFGNMSFTGTTKTMKYFTLTVKFEGEGVSNADTPHAVTPLY